MRFLVLALALGLAACASEPRVASSTTDAVTVVYPSGSQATADQRAAQECNRYAKRAKLRNIRDDADGWKMAIYDCAT
jgi:ABC-type glycerol-3-phosphate transport system substrate-binding protein